MNAKRIVIDASAALKWRLRDEEAASEAAQLLRDAVSGHLTLLTPTLFDYEITNAFRTAILMKRMSEQDAWSAISDFQALAIERYSFLDLQEFAFQLACQHQCSVYDASYLALALSHNIWFYTGDRRLFNALGRHFPWLQWIGHYQSGTIPD